MEKKYILLMIVLCFVFKMQAQRVGINTEEPQRLFHVDGLKNTSANANVSDDLVIDENGRLGIGTLNPTAKLHIETSTNNPFSLNDGTQGASRMLQSDAAGNASWVSRQGVTIKASVNFPTTTTIPSVATTGSYESGVPMQTDVPLVARESGNYIVVLRWWGWRLPTTLSYNSAYIRLFMNNETVHRDAIEHYFAGENGHYFGFCVVLYTSATKGDVFRLTVMATNGPDWTIAGVGTGVVLRPSILLIKI